MTQTMQRPLFNAKVCRIALAIALAAGWCRAEAPATRPAVSGEARPAVATPRGVADLRSLQDRVQAVVAKASPATVGVQIGSSQGSGVIISRDGYVLTAGHVAREPGLNVSVRLAGGRRANAKTLGMNREIDSGLVKITDPGDWPFAELGRSADLKPGEWVVALGHPGGFQRGRPPVLRLGRVLAQNDGIIATDCTLVGGDSGGPLFDLNGRVVGIHSRIGQSTLNNVHVPVDVFVGSWDRLARADAWGDRFSMFGSRAPTLGIDGDNDRRGLKVLSVEPDGPGDKAGLKKGDVITKMDGKTIEGVEDVAQVLIRKRSGNEVALEILRGTEKVELKATLARRSNN